MLMDTDFGALAYSALRTPMAPSRVSDHGSGPRPRITPHSLDSSNGLWMVVTDRTLSMATAMLSVVVVSTPDEDVERLLVKSEPKTHAEWLEDPDATDAEAKHPVRLLVRNITESVRKEVKDCARQLSPD